MNILVYSDYTRINHSVRPEAEIFLQLAARGHRVCIFSPKLDPEEPFSTAGIRTETTGQSAKISISSIRALRRELESESYDIVFATSSRTIPTAAFACIGYPVQLVVYRGTTRGLKRRDPTSFLTVLHPRVDAVVTVSAAVSQAVRKKLYRNKDKVVGIFKGHNADWYTDEPADLSEFGIPKGAFVAIAVARFRPSKGLQYLIEAMKSLADLPSLHLLVVGSGADEEPYSTLIRESGVSDRINVLGRREDALRLTAAADVLIQPSIDGEGLPRSIMEAWGFGKPVISTTVGGAKEVLTEGRTGMLIPPADSDAIARSLRALVEQPAKLEAMREPCRDILREQLSHTATAVAYEDFFEALLETDVTTTEVPIADGSRRYAFSKAYEHRGEALLGLLADFDDEGEVLYQKRNVVKKRAFEDAYLVLKSFRKPGGLRSFIYGQRQKSKARRSFEYGQSLKLLGITTPPPVGYVEDRHHGRLGASYFICEYGKHDFAMTDVFSTTEAAAEIPDTKAVIQAFTRFTFDMHEAGVLHRDHNPGNTLVCKDKDSFRFSVIDINRMRFGPVSLQERLNNFVRLTDDLEYMRLMARTYAELSGENADHCESLLLDLKRRHWRRLSLKKRAKTLLGKQRK